MLVGLPPKDLGSKKLKANAGYAKAPSPLRPSRFFESLREIFYLLLREELFQSIPRIKVLGA